MMARGIVSSLKARGFDRSRSVPFERGAIVGCSQCDAICINGHPCHETGCPNVVPACRECGCPDPDGTCCKPCED